MEKLKKTNTLYSSFMFLKLDPAFRRLETNEKMAAKQEFENVIARHQEKLFLRTYQINGLRADCDLLIWRISNNLEHLQDMCAKTFLDGIGKYLTPVHSFIGLYNLNENALKKDLDFEFIPKDTFGKFKFMLVHPLVKSHLWHELSDEERVNLVNKRQEVLANHKDVLEHFFTSYGLDDHELVVTREAKNLEELVIATKELQTQKTKNFTLTDRPILMCIGKDLSVILDTIS
ncbi:MAG: chlorite dismutase family protein [Elusimicrobiota bacterium]|nr:chlorite dismutase family protein [Elusimicrobiota bacterium]